MPLVEVTGHSIFELGFNFQGSALGVSVTYFES